MNRRRRPRAIAICFLALWVLIAAAPGVVLAQSISAGMPENAHAKSHGQRWECERSYRAVDEACIGIGLPENAHVDYSGNDWSCNRPYRQQGDRCVLP